ncbi:hypothetical protein [Pedobacter frigoris]|uniref:hypothetical protein n=1 Tax=Pedobacter frigoris TaxID=2571272 RepID=UPI00292FAB31|nr:hypothetical protein [Pedobacter frigoris]
MESFSFYKSLYDKELTRSTTLNEEREFDEERVGVNYFEFLKYCIQRLVVS